MKTVVLILVLVSVLVGCESLYMKPKPCACEKGEQMKDINGAA